MNIDYLFILCFSFQMFSLCGQTGKNNQDEVFCQIPDKDVTLFISKGRSLPTAVLSPDSKSEEWKLERKNCIELYLKWYSKMLALGFDVNSRGFYGLSGGGITVVSSQEISEAEKINNIKVRNLTSSIACFDIAETRLKLFIKYSYKGRKSKFKRELKHFDNDYSNAIRIIKKVVLKRKKGFTIKSRNNH